MTHFYRFVLLAPIILLAGCDSPGWVQRTADGRETGFVIYTDDYTGCQYVRPAYHEGLQPRMGRDGKQVCVVTSGLKVE
jgi:hypothetical protein